MKVNIEYLRTGLQVGNKNYPWISEDKRNNPDYNLYLFAEEFEGQHYVKFGLADKQTINQRYSGTGAHAHQLHMIGAWSVKEPRQMEQKVHNALQLSSKVNPGYRYEGYHESETEYYHITNESGYDNVFETIEDVIQVKNAIRTEKLLYDSVKKLVNEVIESKEDCFLLDLCPRWGKTRTMIEILRKSDYRAMFMLSYVGTVRSSYNEDLETVIGYEHIKFIDADSENALTDALNWLDSNPSNKVMYYIALTGDSSDVDNIEDDEIASDEEKRIACFERRTSNLALLAKYGTAICIEEVDFGAHCPNQVKKIKKLHGMVKTRKCYATTGTNADRALKIFNQLLNKKAIKIIRREYDKDVLHDSSRKNAVGINWRVLNNSGLCECFSEYYAPEMMENFDYMLKVDHNGKLRGDVWFRQVLRVLFMTDTFMGSWSPEHRKFYKIIQNSEFIDRNGATMIFTSGSNESHEPLKKIIIETCGGETAVHVEIIDSNNTTNAEAERLVKALVADCKNQGKKLFIIAGFMANRSFSIGQISNVILFMNGGSYSNISQKIARGLTPCDDINKKFCNIIDFRMEYNSSNMERYLTGYASANLQDNNDFEASTGFISGTDKINFIEYFMSFKNPIHELTDQEIALMIESSPEFIHVKNEKILSNVILDESKVRTPRIIGGAVGETLEINLLENKNIKGDADKKIRQLAKAKSADETPEEKEEREALAEAARRKLEIYYWLCNNYWGQFNTGRYLDLEDWFYIEFEELAQNLELVKFIESDFEIDFGTLSDIISVLKEANCKFPKL